jgi:hypothetical protein
MLIASSEPIAIKSCLKSTNGSSQLSSHLMLHVELVGEDGAGLLVELLDEGGQGVLVQVRNVGHVANLQQHQVSSIRQKYIESQREDRLQPGRWAPIETAADRGLSILLQLVSHWEPIRASQLLLDQ